MLRPMSLAAVLLAVFALCSCATPIGVLSPSAGSKDNFVYIDGSPFIVSELNRSVISIGPATPTVTISQPLRFLLSVRNIDTAPIIVGPSQMRVTTDSGLPIKVFTAVELERDAQRKAMWLGFAAGLEKNPALSHHMLQQAYSTLEKAQSGTFQIQTISPGESYTTPVTVDRLPQGVKSITIEIEILGEVHRAEFIYQQP